MAVLRHCGDERARGRGYLGVGPDDDACSRVSIRAAGRMCFRAGDTSGRKKLGTGSACRNRLVVLEGVGEKLDRVRLYLQRINRCLSAGHIHRVEQHRARSENAELRSHFFRAGGLERPYMPANETRQRTLGHQRFLHRVDRVALASLGAQDRDLAGPDRRHLRPVRIVDDAQRGR